MTKARIVQGIYESLERQLSRKTVADIVDQMFNEVKHSLHQTGRFTYPGFGTFRVKTLAPRQMRNIQTKELMQLGERRTVGFKPADELKGEFKA
jgi:DNA-binding protein HU-beta